MKKTAKKVTASSYAGPILLDVEYRRKRFGESNVFASRHLPNLIKGGLNLIFMPAESFGQVVCLYKELRESNGEYLLVKSASEASNVINEGKFACVLAAGYQTIGSDMSPLEMLYELGVRLFTISGNRKNFYTDGCGEREASGLSYAGVDLVGKLEDLGIIVDVSHTSDKGVQDILDVTNTAMVVASHANSRQICDNLRNLSDEKIKAIAERGGMVGTSFHPTLVSWNKPDVNDVVKHIIYIKDLVGSSHIGLGTDWLDFAKDFFKHEIKNIDPSGKLYGGLQYPKGLETASKLGNIFKKLKIEGIEEEDINKIRGENIMRTFKYISF